ncbi:MAG: tRNA lysidine(34) synthetase TilS [Chitinophagia bacterium]|nr:tRNA lysidine(34) synthetase TilS [Chitinophagia bacterium]
MSLATELQQYIASQNQLRKGEGALLAVSGGVDSMVMAHLFREAGIAFAVAHCNFQLRGAEADKDETLVQQWCTDYNIAFYNVRFDTQAVAEQEKTGIQETARTLRYTWLESLRKTHKWHKIATAHHLDDNVETVLMNMLRGTGIAGMHGILPVNGKRRTAGVCQSQCGTLPRRCLQRQRLLYSKYYPAPYCARNGTILSGCCRAHSGDYWAPGRSGNTIQ